MNRRKQDELVKPLWGGIEFTYNLSMKAKADGSACICGVLKNKGVRVKMSRIPRYSKSGRFLGNYKRIPTKEIWWSKRVILDIFIEKGLARHPNGKLMECGL